MIQHFNKFGSLRDMICQSKPKENFLHKYCKPKSATVIGFEQMQNFGCQLLKALKFLSDKGFPYGKVLLRVLCVSCDIHRCFLFIIEIQ